MKWAFAIQRKLRLAIFMAVMMLIIILFTLIESYNVSRISKSFSSIYDDRLIPAMDLHQISQQINDRNNRMVLFLFGETTTAIALQRDLAATDQVLDKLLAKYEKTYLVREESIRLATFKQKLNNFRRDEKLLISAAIQDKTTASRLYFNNTLPLFNEANNHLLELNKVQTTVGKKLLGDSLGIASDSDLITTLQIVIGIILGVMIIILITTSKEVLIKLKDFNMN